MEPVDRLLDCDAAIQDHVVPLYVLIVQYRKTVEYC